MNSEELKQKRTSLGLTQSDLAQAIGKSRKTINSYEQGASIPKSVETLLAMYFDRVTKGYKEIPKKNPEKEVNSMEEILANAIYERLKPLISEATTSRKIMLENSKSILNLIQHLMLDIEEFKITIEELQETIEAIDTKVQKIPTTD